MSTFYNRPNLSYLTVHKPFLGSYELPQEKDQQTCKVYLFIDYRYPYLSDENILLRYNNILESDSSGIRRALTHILLLPNRSNSLSICVHNKPCEGLASWTLKFRVGTRQDEVIVCNSNVGYPHLLTVYHPFISFLLSLGFNPSNIWSCSRFLIYTRD